MVVYKENEAFIIKKGKNGSVQGKASDFRALSLITSGSGIKP